LFHSLPASAILAADSPGNERGSSRRFCDDARVMEGLGLSRQVSDKQGSAVLVNPDRSRCSLGHGDVPWRSADQEQRFRGDGTHKRRTGSNATESSKKWMRSDQWQQNSPARRARSRSPSHYSDERMRSPTKYWRHDEPQGGEGDPWREAGPHHTPSQSSDPFAPSTHCFPTHSSDHEPSRYPGLRSEGGAQSDVSVISEDDLPSGWDTLAAQPRVCSPHVDELLPLAPFTVAATLRSLAIDPRMLNLALASDTLKAALLTAGVALTSIAGEEGHSRAFQGGGVQLVRQRQRQEPAEGKANAPILMGQLMRAACDAYRAAGTSNLRASAASPAMAK